MNGKQPGCDKRCHGAANCAVGWADGSCGAKPPGTARPPLFPPRFPETCERCGSWVYHRTVPCECNMNRKTEPKPICERIGEMVRDRRKELRLSMDELAERTALSKTHIWQIETGRSEPGAGVIVRLCRVLDVSADRLLGIQEH